MRGNSHVRFGERNGETHLSQGRKVRSVSTHTDFGHGGDLEHHERPRRRDQHDYHG